jgi:hypothetical protein
MPTVPPEKSSAPHVAAAFLLGIGGLLGLVFGIVTAVKDWNARQRVAEIAALPIAASLRVGERAILEGRIARDGPVLADGFVAYERRQQQRSGTIASRETQPLRIETDGGVVLIVNSDYAFDEWVSNWGHVSRDFPPSGLTQGGGTVQGLVPGEILMAIGRFNSIGGFEAEGIVAGPRERYFAAVAARIAREWTVAWPGLLISPILIGYAAWLFRRIVREP